MTDVEKKRRDLRTADQTRRPALGRMSSSAPPSSHWYATALEAQDHVVGGQHRIVGAFHLNDSSLALDDGTNPATIGTAAYFTDDAQREAFRSRFLVAPGCALEYRALYLPTGPTVVASGGGYVEETRSGGPYITHAWTNGTDNSSETRQESAVASGSQYGSIETGAGQAWYQMREIYVSPPLHPADEGDDDELDKYSEDTSVEVTAGQWGGGRLVSMTVSERPWVHVADEGEVQTTIHGYSERRNPYREPRIKGPTQDYEEERFGVRKGDNVARRQSERVGPILAQWSPYSSSDDTPSASGGAASIPVVTVTSTSFVGLWDSSKTGWSAAQPGHILPGHYAIRHTEGEIARLDGSFARVIPVRVHVYGSGAEGGYDGTVRFQASSRSWVEVTIPNASEPGWFTATGWLECTGHPLDEDAATIANLQVFALVGGGTLSVHYYCVEFGHHAQV